MVEISERLLTQIEATTIQMRRELTKGERRVGTFQKKTTSLVGKVDASFDSLGESVRRNLEPRRLAAFATATGAAFAFATKKALEYADTIGKTADRVGVTTDQLQELRFAAQQVGVESRQLDIALQRFVRRTAEAAQGSGELVKVLDKYNIEVKDANGQTRDSVDVLKDLADATRGAESGAEQLRIAFKAFDSEGAALVNLLRQGSEGIERFQQQARDLGLVMDENLIRKAEQANDELNILAQSLKTQVAGALASISPAIIKLGKDLRDVIPVIIEFWERWALPENMQSVEMLNRRMAETLKIIKEFETGVRSESLLPDLAPGIQSLKEAREEFDRLSAARADAIKTREALEALREVRTGGNAVVAESTEITDEESDAIARRIVAMNEDIRITDESSDAITRRIIAMRESSRITDEEAENITGRLKEINEAQKENTESVTDYSQAAREGLRATEDALSGNLKSWQDWGAAIIRILTEVVLAQSRVSPGGGGGGGLLGLFTPTVRHSGGTASEGLHSLQRGEEIINRRAASQPGVRPMLKAINSGVKIPSLGGGSASITIGTIDARGASPDVVPMIEAALARQVSRLNSFGQTAGQRRRDLIGNVRRGATDFV